MNGRTDANIEELLKAMPEDYNPYDEGQEQHFREEEDAIHNYKPLLTSLRRIRHLLTLAITTPTGNAKDTLIEAALEIADEGLNHE